MSSASTSGNLSAEVYRAGTERVVDPATTLSRVRPYFPLFGIAHVADVTGLDHIGIQVVMIVRPIVRSLSVAQGTSITFDAATGYQPRPNAAESCHGGDQICAGLVEAFEQAAVAVGVWESTSDINLPSVPGLEGASNINGYVRGRRAREARKCANA
jgi:ribosomal protein S12 methylthiotransferase accessory factor YcaO